MPVDPLNTGVVSDRALWTDQISSANNLDKLGFESLQGATLKTDKTPQALNNSKELFKNFFRTEVAKLTIGMTTEHAAETTARAEAKMNQILDKTFGKLEDKLHDSGKIKDAKAQMLKANSLAYSALRELKGQADGVRMGDMRERLATQQTPLDVPPQIFKQESGGFALLRAAPQIENLVLQGGGAKGFGLGGAVSEMRASGLLDGLKQVVGTSAGALQSVCVAIGMSDEGMKEMNDVSMAKMFVPSPTMSFSIYPDVTTKAILNPMGAIRIVDLLDRKITAEVQSFLGPLDPDELTARIDAFVAQPGSGMTKEQVRERLDVLTNPDYSKSRVGKMVTMNDMKMLHGLEPSKFKEMVLTGYDTKDEKMIYFRAGTETGDVPVAYAARVSMAHPAIASGISLDGGHKLGDGGIGSNVPSEVIYGDDREAASKDSSGDAALQDLRARTAILIFDDQGKAYNKMHAPDEEPGKKTGLFNMIKSGPGKVKDAAIESLTSNPEIKSDNKADGDKVYGGGANVFVVFHGDLSTMSVLAGDDRKVAADTNARMKMLEQLNDRLDDGFNAFTLDVGSVDDAFRLLSDSDKTALLNAGRPTQASYPRPADLAAATALYNLVDAEARAKV